MALKNLFDLLAFFSLSYNLTITVYPAGMSKMRDRSRAFLRSHPELGEVLFTMISCLAECSQAFKYDVINLYSGLEFTIF